MKLFINSKNKNKGQGVMEYIFLTGLIGIFCLATIKTIGGTLKTRLNHINKEIIEKVKI